MRSLPRILWAAISVPLVAALFLCLPAPAAAQTTTTYGLVQKYYGLQTPPVTTDSDVSVGTTAKELTKNDGARIEDIFFNLGSSNCYISHSNQVSTSSGYALLAGGGGIVESWRDDLTLPTEAMWAVCSSGTNDIHITELDLR